MRSWRDRQSLSAKCLVEVRNIISKTASAAWPYCSTKPYNHRVQEVGGRLRGEQEGVSDMTLVIVVKLYFLLCDHGKKTDLLEKLRADSFLLSLV
jgi:hypothetical protein